MSCSQRPIYHRQRGLSMVTFLAVAVVLVIGAIFGMKIVPAYMEYYTLKRAVTRVAAEHRTGTVADVRKGFDAQAAIDNIDVLGARDLDISKDSGEVVVTFAYTKKVPLFRNVSLVIEFEGASNK